jgi:hypothetical protein
LISSFDSDIITVSSAYKSTTSFKYTSSSLSKSSVIDVRPLIFLCLKTVPNHLNTSRKGKGKDFLCIRKVYSTIDNIFALYAFFELLKLKKKKLFVTFVEFEKAFDKVVL